MLASKRISLDRAGVISNERHTLLPSFSKEYRINSMIIKS